MKKEKTRRGREGKIAKMIIIMVSFPFQKR